jgi:hypothetical protein
LASFMEACFFPLFANGSRISFDALFVNDQRGQGLASLFAPASICSRFSFGRDV